MKLINGRLLYRAKFNHRKSRNCLTCIGFTFNGAGICTGCLRGIPMDKKPTTKKVKQ